MACCATVCIPDCALQQVPLLAGLPTELLVLVVGCSDVPIRTYCQLIALTHTLRAQLPPAMRELSFTKNGPEAICDDDDCYYSPVPAAWMLSADAFACLVAPCTSLRHLEVGALDGAGDCGAPVPPAWVVRAFAACGASLVSLRLRGGFDARLVRHLAAQLPNLQELSKDWLLDGDWVRLCPQLRIIRALSVLSRDSAAADACALRSLPHLCEIHLAAQRSDRADEVRACVPPHVRVFPRVCRPSVHAEGDLTDAEATVLCGTNLRDEPLPSVALRVRCPRLQRVDWPFARPLCFDHATAASLASLDLRSPHRRVPFTAEELANNFGVLPNVRRLTLYATDMRAVCSLCADVRVLPRLAALDVFVMGPGRDDEPAPEQVRCKPSLRSLSIRCHHLCVDVVAPHLLCLSTDCGVRLFECRSLVYLSALFSVAIVGDCDADSPGWAGPRALRGLQFLVGDRAAQPPGHILAVMRRARATLTDMTLLVGSSLGAFDAVSQELVAFVCTELPRVRQLSLWGFRGPLPEVRLPHLRRLHVVGTPGLAVSLKKPLQTPLLETLSLECLTIGADSVTPAILGAPADIIMYDVQLEQPERPGDLQQWLARARAPPRR